MLAGFYERMDVVAVFWWHGRDPVVASLDGELRVSTVKSSDVWLYIATKLRNFQEGP
jgi:hypothetical protein